MRLTANRNTATALVVGIGSAIAMQLVFTFFGPDRSSYAEDRIEWKPSFCASITSKDNVPMAVCGDHVRPIYTDVPDGYLGELTGCVIRSAGRVQGCKPKPKST